MRAVAPSMIVSTWELKAVSASLAVSRESLFRSALVVGTVISSAEEIAE